jgi:hypothetical protein
MNLRGAIQKRTTATAMYARAIYGLVLELLRCGEREHEAGDNSLTTCK